MERRGFDIAGYLDDLLTGAFAGIQLIVHDAAAGGSDRAHVLPQSDFEGGLMMPAARRRGVRIVRMCFRKATSRVVL
jgi:hypothetical protein